MGNSYINLFFIHSIIIPVILVCTDEFISQDNDRLHCTSTLSHQAQYRVWIFMFSAWDKDFTVGGAAVDVFSGEGEAEYVGAVALEGG